MDITVSSDIVETFAELVSKSDAIFTHATPVAAIGMDSPNVRLWPAPLIFLPVLSIFFPDFSRFWLRTANPLLFESSDSILLTSPVALFI